MNKEKDEIRKRLADACLKAADGMVSKAQAIYRHVSPLVEELAAKLEPVEKDTVKAVLAVTRNWDATNARRIVLIEAQIKNGLDESKERELAHLQSLADLRIAVFGNFPPSQAVIAAAREAKQGESAVNEPIEITEDDARIEELAREAAKKCNRGPSILGCTDEMVKDRIVRSTEHIADAICTAVGKMNLSNTNLQRSLDVTCECLSDCEERLDVARTAMESAGTLLIGSLGTPSDARQVLDKALAKIKKMQTKGSIGENAPD
jgi:hypothetical protein